MKKTRFVVTLVFLSFVLLSAEEAAIYTDVIDMLQKQYVLMADLDQGCNTAQNVQDVIGFLTRYKNGMKELLPSMKAMAQKYPQMDEILKNNPPPELMAEWQKIKEMSEQITVSFEKVELYKEDPGVKAILMELDRLMMDLAPQTSEEPQTVEETKK